jgi:8-oxo-dGTP pyrophosphatase MutT (NUDIX family)
MHANGHYVEFVVLRTWLAYWVYRAGVVEISQAPVDYTTGLARKRMGSAVLFTDPADRVLLVEPAYKNDWEHPGGAVEADESPYEAAVRELKEELGLSVAPGRLLVADWVPPRPNRTEGVMFVYDGGKLRPAQTSHIQLPPEELKGWAWCTQVEVQRRMTPLLSRRVQAALHARTGGGTAYLEFGQRVV